MKFDRKKITFVEEDGLFFPFILLNFKNSISSGNLKLIVQTSFQKIILEFIFKIYMKKLDFN